MVRQGHVNIQRLLLVDDTPTILLYRCKYLVYIFCFQKPAFKYIDGLSRRQGNQAGAARILFFFFLTFLFLFIYLFS
jgi:hypothetical protein